MPEIQVNIKIKQQVVVVGDSFLWRMEGLICQSHLMSKRACYLPEAQIPDDMERLLRLGLLYVTVHPCWHQWYCEGSCQSYQEWLQSSGCDGEGHGSLHSSSSILMVKEKGLVRSRWVLQVNKCLQSWCQTEIWLLYHMTLFED